jgi:hypothetical protein
MASTIEELKALFGDPSIVPISDVDLNDLFREQIDKHNTDMLLGSTFLNDDNIEKEDVFVYFFIHKTCY